MESREIRAAIESIRENRKQDFADYFKQKKLKHISKLLTKDAIDSDWYKTFSRVRYGSLKNYEMYEKIVLRLSEFMTMYEKRELNGDFIENRKSTNYTSFIINHAYCLGIRPLWLSKPLTEAFSYSTLPKKISALNRVCPIGLMLVPPLIKNEIGKYLKWVLFYHKLPGDSVIPLAFTDKHLHHFEGNVFSAEKEILFFMTEVDGVIITGTRDISLVDNELKSYNDVPVILYGEEEVNEIKAEDYSLVTKIADLIIQTLLYMQMEKITLPAIIPQTQGFSTNRKTKYKKIPPLIIGENYLIKTQRDASGQSRPHGSPVTHWRSGHWRCQPYGGKDNQAYKTIWIEPILVNKPGGC